MKTFDELTPIEKQCLKGLATVEAYLDSTDPEVKMAEACKLAVLVDNTVTSYFKNYHEGLASEINKLVHDALAGAINSGVAESMMLQPGLAEQLLQANVDAENSNPADMLYKIIDPLIFEEKFGEAEQRVCELVGLDQEQAGQVVANRLNHLVEQGKNEEAPTYGNPLEGLPPEAGEEGVEGEGQGEGEPDGAEQDLDYAETVSFRLSPSGEAGGGDDSAKEGQGAPTQAGPEQGEGGLPDAGGGQGTRTEG